MLLSLVALIGRPSNHVFSSKGNIELRRWLHGVISERDGDDNMYVPTNRTRKLRRDRYHRTQKEQIINNGEQRNNHIYIRAYQLISFLSPQTCVLLLHSLRPKPLNSIHKPLCASMKLVLGFIDIV